jgi:hypothetical protein
MRSRTRATTSGRDFTGEANRFEKGGTRRLNNAVAGLDSRAGDRSIAHFYPSRFNCPSLMPSALLESHCSNPGSMGNLAISLNQPIVVHT